MTENYTAACHYEPTDTILVEAFPEESEVRLEAKGCSDRFVSVYLSPKKARRLAKAIKKAAKRAEAEQ